MTENEFFDLLDEAPRTPTSLLVETPQGERRSLPISAFAGQVEFRSAPSARYPRLERCRNRLALLEALSEKENK